MREVQIVCRQLGFKNPLGALRDRQGKGKVWLDEMDCTGTETSLTNCPHAGWGITDSLCKTHRYDAGVVLSG